MGGLKQTISERILAMFTSVLRRGVAKSLAGRRATTKRLGSADFVICLHI